ncbi:MAG: hypothetical protein K2G36_02675 [Ruminococcus sp.]|nr:hypothetical protein [Ruminococcus sp.]
MADTRFTALGLSGSGKTCYVLGMYYEMVTGMKGFTLKTANETASKLEDWMDKLDDETGADRFPAGTGLTEVSNYAFDMNYQNKYVMSFDWMDYGGRTLREKEKNPQAFAELQKSIKESTALYIFIDGELLCEEETEEKIKKVKRKCGRIINPFITDFIQENGSNLPPIVFVITKSDLCREYIKSTGEVYDVISESFSSVFGKDGRCYITTVSLGEDIEEEDGEADPINIQIPFFIGIYHEFLNICYGIKYQIEEDERGHREAINRNQNEIARQNNRWFFTDYDAISQARSNIQNAEASIANNKEYLKYIKKLLLSVAGELTRLSSNFVLIEGGKETDFSADEAYEF